MPVDKDSVAYYNGKVHTLNNLGQVAEAFIVTLITYNLNGRFVMPGIHDAHVHLLSAGISYLSGVSLAGDTTVENIGQRLQEGQCTCAYQHAFQDWVVGNTFAIPNFDRSSLDHDFPDTPVVILGGAGHSAFLNTTGLQKAGYDVDNEPDFKGAKFGRRADGSLTGELAELAMNKVMLSKGNPNITHAKRAIKAAIRRLHQVGVTSCQEAATNTIILNALREMDEENALHMDIAAHSILLDGVPLPPMFSSAGLDDEGNIEKDKILVDDVIEAVKRFDERGLTVKIHATGRGSTRLALDAIEAARQGNENSRTGSIVKHEIAHCNGIHPDDFERFQKQNITAELSPAMFFDHPLTQASNGAMNWDFAQLLKARAYPITIGSDWGSRGDPSLLNKVHHVVRRVGDWAVNNSAIAVQENSNTPVSLGARLVLEILTNNGATAVGLSDKNGSIEVGKRANFIMLDRDVVSDNEEVVADFENVKVLKTWFEGELVWDAEAE
ncbi:amidohydrolase 3 [Talaromyces proteolyticus]|uniref:Amidohydrolase 3 n=1 Tax=Talaromyces proteolyticus TaxID=1131652 RepID=A0AAD4PS16_9EURO|nr:amidohydrolase 3 [Talaromyces proteolyticus]KAH8690220.1 amidohydrolase 3 [Talaromyces proteolyticus]